MVLISKQVYEGQPVGVAQVGEYITARSGVMYKNYKVINNDHVLQKVDKQLFAIKMLLRHLGIIGEVDVDLWAKYSNQELLAMASSAFYNFGIYLKSIWPLFDELIREDNLNSTVIVWLIEELINNPTIYNKYTNIYMFFYEGTSVRANPRTPDIHDLLTRKEFSLIPT